MATVTTTTTTEHKVLPAAPPQHKEPLKLSGALDSYNFVESTPIIGREYPDANLKEWLEAPNSDELIRDLAITISRRGVVFFRKQDELDNERMKELAQRLGELTGKPSTSKLHIHPVVNSGRTLGGKDDQISVISSEQFKQIYADRFQYNKSQSQKKLWHSDITFEPVPADCKSSNLVDLSPRQTISLTSPHRGFQILCFA